MATHSNIASIILAQVCGAYAHFSKQHGGREGQVPELLFFMRYVSDICLDVGIFVCFTITSCSVFISMCRICLVFFRVLIVWFYNWCMNALMHVWMNFALCPTSYTCIVVTWWCISIYTHCIVADLEDFYELSVQWKLKTISFLRQVLYAMLPWLCCVSMDLEVLYKSASPSSFSSGYHFFWAVPNKFPYLGMFVFQQQAAAGGSQEGGKKRTKATAKKTKASECAHGI